MYQVVSVIRSATSDRVDVTSHHLSSDIKEARRVLERIKTREKENGESNDVGIRELHGDGNKLLIIYRSGVWKSVGLNEIKTSDGELLIELN